MSSLETKLWTETRNISAFKFIFDLSKWNFQILVKSDNANLNTAQKKINKASFYS